jgi:hypothetical protein
MPVVREEIIFILKHKPPTKPIYAAPHHTDVREVAACHGY